MCIFCAFFLASCENDVFVDTPDFSVSGKVLSHAGDQVLIDCDERFVEPPFVSFYTLDENGEPAPLDWLPFGEQLKDPCSRWEWWLGVSVSYEKDGRVTVVMDYNNYDKPVYLSLECSLEYSMRTVILVFLPDEKEAES